MLKIDSALDTLQSLVRQYPDGMLPAHLCKCCGAELGKNPAEVYLGTYTGLCYACQNGAAYPERTYSSGAVTWSFPPHCPAWRRDREHFIGFADCTDPRCGGQGRIMISRRDSQGGSYPINCDACSTRHYSHPLTRREQAEHTDAWIMRFCGSRKAGVRPAEVILHELGRTGHLTYAQAQRTIARRLQARGVTL